MNSITFEKPFESKITDIKSPVCQSDDVLLQMIRIGVCGTDQQVFKGKNRYMQFPLVPFHEGIGKIVDMGERVVGFQTGDLVVVHPIMNCGSCYSCSRGKVNACENFNCIGVQSPGLGAEFIAINYKHVFKIDEKLSLDASILIEPFAVGVHAARQGEVSGKNVLVIGAGTIGNFTAQACRLLGAISVAISDIDTEKLKFSLECGVDHAIDLNTIPIKEWLLEKDFVPDVIIDCAGAPSALTDYLSFARKTSTIIIVANYSSPVTIDIATIQRNELIVKGCITYTYTDFKMALEFIQKGRVHTDGFIKARYEFFDVQKMMMDIVNGNSNSLKSIMDFNLEG